MKYNMDNLKKGYKAIDMMKLFFAICIVCLHSGGINFLPGVLRYAITQFVFRMAVPFFFVTSGFFLGKKLKENEENAVQIVINYCKRLLRPFIFFEFINACLQIIKMYCLDNYNIKEILVDAIQHTIFYPYGAMWYVQASIIGALLLIPIVKKGNYRLGFLAGCILYIFALVCNSYYFVVENTIFQPIIDEYLSICISARNGIFVGFIYLEIGIIFGKRYSEEKKKSSTKWVYLIVAAILYLLEIILLLNKNFTDDNALYISQLIFAPILLKFLLEINIPIKFNTSVLRYLSSSIYFMHRFILALFSILITIIFKMTLPGAIMFVITSLVSVIISLYSFKSKKYLYNILK